MLSSITKSALRKITLFYRQLLSEKEFQDRNHALLNQVARFISEGNHQVIQTFLPIRHNREPDVTSLLNEWYLEKRKTILSKTDFKTRTMEHFYYEPTARLVKNRLGIPEPQTGKLATMDEVEVILVPLMLADKKGNRLGYGGGFYDQLLKETKALKVGLSLGPPIDDLFQKDEWDIPLDLLITPDTIYRYGKNSTTRK